MSFLTPAFFLLLPACALLYPRVPKRARRALLLAASWLFYGWGAPKTLLLLIASSLVTWGCGLLAEKRPRPARLLAAAACLGCLAVFKYAGFAAELLSLLTGLNIPAPEIVLPVGISFYTFQMLSYVLDVAAGRLPAERHFGYYALYVSFFPQLVAGPIERPGDLLPQLRAARDPDREDREAGLLLLGRGYVKKLLVADAAAAVADRVFAQPEAAGGPAVILAAALFALQIYGDFSGYSDIALGCGRLLGIRLTENFRAPYAAVTVRDFWRRWHITLTRWFTDYLYIPLGGSRRGRARHVLNLLIVFAVSGLWHGAGLTYVVWGLLHGLYLAAETLLPALGRTPEKGAARLVRRLLTLAAVGFAWIFFRAATVADALTLIGRLGTGWGALPLTMSDLAGLARLVPALALLYLTRREGGERPGGERLALLFFWVTAACAVSALAAAAAGTEGSFIYFRF